MLILPSHLCLSLHLLRGFLRTRRTQCPPVYTLPTLSCCLAPFLSSSPAPLLTCLDSLATPSSRLVCICSIAKACPWLHLTSGLQKKERRGLFPFLMNIRLTASTETGSSGKSALAQRCGSVCMCVCVLIQVHVDSHTPN